MSKTTTAQIIWGLLCLCLSLSHIAAQDLRSNLRQRLIPFPHTHTDSFQLDTLSILPGSVQIMLLPQGATLDTACYTIDYARATIYYRPAMAAARRSRSTDTTNSGVGTDSLLQVRYRTLGIWLPQTNYRKDLAQITRPDTDPLAHYGYTPPKTTAADRLFSTEGMAYSGSIGRGISFGNAQDLVVNSNFNLPMSGKVAGDIEVLAAMTDNNIPFQPEGNTQQLQEFDRIFIQLKRRNATLLLGDYSLKKPDTYFMNFTRRLQGAQLSYQNLQPTTNSNKENTTRSTPEPTTTAAGLPPDGIAPPPTPTKAQWNAGIAAAVARGNYRRTDFAAAEGNQGRYKLIGANGETFIIVLSDSERVFLDGKRLTRGSDSDYIIDYSTAEVTFTPRQIITKDRRITIEFEYADRNYLRSTLYGYGTWQKKGYAMRIDAFSEQDAKNQPLSNGVINPDQQSRLSAAGNDPAKMITRSADSIAYTTERVLYRLVADTVVAQQHYDSIFVFSTNPQNAHYAVAFSFVGAQKGNYRVAANKANGRVYEWIAPDTTNLLPQGDYEPLIRLAAPLTRQMASLQTQWQYAPQGKLQTDIALARNDPNTFSDIDDEKNSGVATRISLEQYWILPNNPKKAQPNNALPIAATEKSINLNAQYEWVQATFKPLEPYRNVEFGRDWNLNIQPNNAATINTDNTTLALADEHLAALSLNYKTAKTNTNYTANLLMRGKKQYSGWRHQWQGTGAVPDKGWAWQWQISYLTAQNDTTSRSYFWRPSATLSKRIRLPKTEQALQTQLRLNAEHNRIVHADSEQLAPAAFAFHQSELTLQWGDSTRSHLRLTALRRYDYAPRNQQLALANHAQNISLAGSWRPNPQHQFTWNMSYRYLAVADTTISLVKQNNRSLLGDLNYQGNIHKGFVRLGTQYQIGAGQKQRTELYYQKVPDGTGNFIWRDNNNDGIEQPDEFEIANANDLVLAHYIQIALPTTEYQATHIVQWIQTIAINFRQLWSEPKGIQRFWSLFSWQSNINLRRETLAQQGQWRQFIPFVASGDSANIVGDNTNMRHTLFLNRNQPKWEINAYNARLSNTNLLTGGTDTRRRTEWGGLAKYALSRRFTLTVNTATGRSSQLSQAFANRNFEVAFWSIEPSLAFLPNKFFRITGTWRYKNSNNRLVAADQPAQQQQLSIETRYGTAIQSAVTARLAYTSIAYDGDPKSTVAYTLLDGFQPGSNYQWNINFDTRLGGGLQLNLGYEGRQSGSSPVLHTGRASLRAVF
ncbi:MAG: hypothetical protein IPL33_12835 [Sphingobacteriales bacterium]|nr:hypothetical protein [Sphingobacteriales bacterium]